MIIAAIALVGYAVSFWAACHALLHKREPQAALGWVAFIILVPFIGVLAYLLVGVSRVDSHAARLVSSAALAQSQIDVVMEHINLPQASPLLDGEPLPPEHVLERVGRTLTGNALIPGNQVDLLRNGEEAYPAMLDAIRAATSHIYLSTYIFKGGRIGDEFGTALGDAAQRGVDVRLIVDGLGGSLYSWDKPWSRLAERGVKVAQFLPTRFFPPKISINLRTHRKVLVCDGLVGFTGGMNISDDHMVADVSRKFRVQDIHFHCLGLIVIRLQEAFLMDWAFVTGRESLPPPVSPRQQGDSRCRLVFDALGKGRDDIHDLLCGVIGGARRTVRIMTPYFLPPKELKSALISASLRGVEVSLILPAVNNISYVHRASLHMQPGLVRKGVKVYFQPAPFAHSKLLLVDDAYSLVGSANLDPRSLFLNFELNIEVFDSGFNATMTQYFEEVRHRSAEAGQSFYSRRMLPDRLMDAAFWLFSPYL